jgi:hypothetical protein
MTKNNHIVEILRGWALTLVLLGSVGVAAQATSEATLLLPSDSNAWDVAPGTHLGRSPRAMGSVEVRGTGALEFDPTQVETLRPDLFQLGHFSIFDVLVYLANQGLISMEYTFDEAMDTYAIATLNGLSGWWYDAHYAGGTFDRPVSRMDHFPVKDGVSVVIYLEKPDRLAAMEADFREEVARREANGGALIVPTVTLQTPRARLIFSDVSVTPHGVRSDVFRSGVVTALDVLLSLGEQGALRELSLTWRADTDDGDPIDAYLVDGVAGEGFAPESTGSCAFAHVVSSAVVEEFLLPHGHTTSHIHLSADLDVLVSPETVEWIWVCL